MLDLNIYLKIYSYVVKRYEPVLDEYFFYNAKDKTFWNCNSSIGHVISCLNGSLCVGEILDIISENTPESIRDDVLKNIQETFKFLIKERFIYET